MAFEGQIAMKVLAPLVTIPYRRTKNENNCVAPSVIFVNILLTSGDVEGYPVSSKKAFTFSLISPSYFDADKP